MPKDDSIIQEVRAVRRRIAQDCENDVRKITQHADKAYEAFLARTHAA